MCRGTHLFCCFTVTPEDRPRLHWHKLSRKKLWKKNEWKCHVIMFMVCGLRAETEHRKYKWLQLHVASERRIARLEMDTREHFEVRWQFQSIKVCVWCVAFSSPFFELLSQMVDFLWSHSAVRLLPYRDATERRVSGQREEKRRSNSSLLKS